MTGRYEIQARRWGEDWQSVIRTDDWQVADDVEANSKRLMMWTRRIHHPEPAK